MKIRATTKNLSTLFRYSTTRFYFLISIVSNIPQRVKQFFHAVLTINEIKFANDLQQRANNKNNARGLPFSALLIMLFTDG